MSYSIGRNGSRRERLPECLYLIPYVILVAARGVLREFGQGPREVWG